MTIGVSRWMGVCAVLVALGFAWPVKADDNSIVILIKDGKFVPNEVPVPANQKVKLIVRNQDSSMSEFESVEFHREKVVSPGKEVSIYAGPLETGSYEFFDDMHPDNRGHLVVK